MNLRIPLSVFAVASVIGLMAVTAIAAMSMQKAYSIEAWCYRTDNGGATNNPQMACFFGANSQAQCNAARDEFIKQGKTAGSGCFKD